MGNFDVVGLTAVICLFGLPFLCGIIAIVASAWTKAACHQKDVDLKHHMLAAGMSAEEIERVLNAGKGIKDETPVETWSDRES